MSIDAQRFEKAKEKIIGNTRDRSSIGTLSEKTVHAVLKNYYEPDESKQEIAIEGMYADIFTGEEIVEIQTRSFDRLRNKLTRFLPLYPVTVVLPIPSTKWLIWINEETGELTEKRKSPKKGSYYDAFPELYKIRPFLTHPNLSIRLVLMDMEEYRLLNGWSTDKKKGSCRYDRIPHRIVEEITFYQKEDYMQLIPLTLPEEFTAKDFAKASKINARKAGVTLLLLRETGVITQTGKRGREYLYQTTY